jgi:hypothetical protein
MAKVTNPLHSIDARGALARTLTFSHVTGSAVVKKFSEPAKRVTAAQQARRVIYLDAVTTWNALTATEKAAYSAQAEPLKITGYNLFLSQHIAPTPPAGTLWDGGATSWDGGATSWDI